jgi:hypothetical protein
VQLIFLIGPGPARRIPGSESQPTSRKVGRGRNSLHPSFRARRFAVPRNDGSVANSTRTGKSLRFYGIVSSLKIKNISLYQNSDLRYQLPHPAPTEGRFAIVTIRWAQDAMAAAISGATAWFPKGIKARHRTKERRGRRSRVVLAPRPWRYVGGNLPPATGARKAASPERARISRKPIARGKPGCLGCTCG